MNTIALKEKGYIFYVREIRSRFGNILICLENMLLLAKNTQSSLSIKRIKNVYDTFHLPTPLFIDFRSEKNFNCNRVIAHKKTFITKYPYDKNLFVDKDYWCLNYIYDLLKKEKPLTKICDDTLILNIRGGRDIFRKKKINGDYFQQPLSYYKHIIKNSGHEDILIITDSIKYNPVIKTLLLWSPKIRLSDGNTTSQVNLILNAKHLVTARSTFSYILGRLSKNLKSIYTWLDNDEKWDEFQPTNFNCLSKDLKITKYYSDDYIRLGEWTASKDQLDLMLNYSMKKLKFKIEK